MFAKAFTETSLLIFIWLEADRKQHRR